MNRLIKRLSKLKENRGALATLRQGLNERTCWRVWPYIPEFLNNDRSRIVAQTVVAAFAYHPGARRVGNIGTTCRELASKAGLSTFNSRFERLLAAQSVQEVCKHLRSIILASAQKDIVLNHEQLFEDLSRWEWGDRVRLQWATEFYKGEEEDVFNESAD